MDGEVSSSSTSPDVLGPSLFLRARLGRCTHAFRDGLSADPGSEVVPDLALPRVVLVVDKLSPAPAPGVDGAAGSSCGRVCGTSSCAEGRSVPILDTIVSAWADILLAGLAEGLMERNQDADAASAVSSSSFLARQPVFLSPLDYDFVQSTANLPLQLLCQQSMKTIDRLTTNPF